MRLSVTGLLLVGRPSGCNCSVECASSIHHDGSGDARGTLAGGEVLLQYLKEPGEPGRVCSPGRAGDEHSINDGFSEPHGDEYPAGARYFRGTGRIGTHSLSCERAGGRQ